MSDFDDSQIFPTFVTWDWDEQEINLNIPSINHSQAAEMGFPLIAFGINREDYLELFRQDDGINLEKVKAAAIDNLGQIEVSVLTVNEELPFLVVTNSYFACEMILNKEFMQEIQAHLKTDSLLVGLPKKGEMFVSTAINSPENISQFKRIVAQKFSDFNERPSLCHHLYIVQNGEIVGISPNNEDFDFE